MIVVRILFWLLILALRFVLAVLILPFRILGGIGKLGGPGIRVTRGPINPFPTGPVWSKPFSGPWH